MLTVYGRAPLKRAPKRVPAHVARKAQELANKTATTVVVYSPAAQLRANYHLPPVYKIVAVNIFGGGCPILATFQPEVRS